MPYALLSVYGPVLVLWEDQRKRTRMHSSEAYTTGRRRRRNGSKGEGRNIETG